MSYIFTLETFINEPFPKKAQDVTHFSSQVACEELI